MNIFKMIGNKDIKGLLANRLVLDFFWMIVFGILSFLFGMVKFYIPGIDGATSDLREIPLLISMFHVSNPLFSIGVSLISSFNSPAGGSFLVTFVMHAGALPVFWVLIRNLKKQNTSIGFKGIICLIYVLGYYLLLLFPLDIYTNYLVHLNLDKKFADFYMELVRESHFEIISTVMITTLYFVQHNYRVMLNMHLENLEETVNERTLELNLVIEELKTTQQYLIQKEKMASLGILSAGIAHEINNPLNFISGGLLLLSEVKNEISTGEAPGEFISKFESANEMIHDGFSKSVEIVNALMSFSVRGNSNLVVADIHAIIENTLLFLNYRIPSGVRIKKDFQLQAKIPLFAEKMNQVIVNIIDNALFEFNHESTSNAEITISTSQLEDYACIKISNNGRKIPEKYLNRIFDPFFTTKDPGQGVGLGLSISYALVHEHSGRIHAENSEDGVVFIIELPMNK